MLARGRRATRRVPGTRPDDAAGAVGASQRRTHPRVRRSGRLAGRAHLEERGHRADAHRVAHGWGDRGAGLGRCRRAGGSPRRVASDRDRRGLLQARPPLLDGRGRSRHRDTGVGRARTRRSHAGCVLRRARHATSRPDHPCQRRCGALGRHRRRAASSRSVARTPGDARTRSTSSRGPPKRSTRCGATRGTKPEEHSIVDARAAPVGMPAR